MKNANRKSVPAVTSAVTWSKTTITKATAARIKRLRTSGLMRSCRRGRRAPRRPASLPRTRAGAREALPARTARARGRRGAQRCRRRSGDGRSPSDGRTGAAARARPGRRPASGPGGAAVRRRPRHSLDGAPRARPARPPRRRRAPGMRSHGGPLASTKTYREDAVVEEGKPAPDFELTSDSGETVKLSDLRGKQVVLYFYPKDDTPGCTAQACGIRDVYGEFERAGAVVLGVSPDDERSHVKFKAKYDLPFTLLADADHAVSEDYGVWGEKTYMGKKYMGIDRTTFVIADDGTVKRARNKVKPDTHADDVLQTFRSKRDTRPWSAGSEPGSTELRQGHRTIVADTGEIVAELRA